MYQVKEKLSHSSHTKGFTLIEVVAVLAIIGSLIVAIIPSIKVAMNRSLDTQLKTKLTMIAGAGQVYKLDTGRYPDSIDTLVKNGYLPDRDYIGIEYDTKNGIAKGKSASGKDFSSAKDGS